MLSVTADQTALTPELNSTSQVKVTLTGSGGFTGNVALAATIMDASNKPITAWTVAFDNASIDFTADGTQMATATLTIPSQNMGLAGNLTITATSSLGMTTLPVAVTVSNQLTFNVTANGTQCAYPTGISQAAPTKINVGTKIRFANMTNFTIVIHSNGGTDGIAHEDLAGMGPNGVYEQTLSGTGTAAFSWYCHSPGPDLGSSNPFIAAMP